MNLLPSKFGVVSLCVLLFVSFLNADINLKRKAIARTTPPISLEVGTLPNLFAIFSEPSIADLYWVETIVLDGEYKRAGVSSPDALIARGMNLAKMDPYFLPTYEWIPAAYLSRRSSVSEEELARLADLIEKGIEAHPKDGYLPFSAAMLFIGHSPTNDRQRRIREISRAIEYLRLAEGKAGAYNDVPALMASLSRRLNHLRGGTGQIETNIVAISEMVNETASTKDTKTITLRYMNPTLANVLAAER